MAIFKEFREFALKGNFVDLAVGVIIGAASGKVVSSIVADIITPPIGLALGRVNFADLKIVLKEPLVENGKEVAKAITVNYGLTIQTLLDYFILAFIVFLVVRMVNKLKKAAPPAPPTPQETLLAEIRDLLKKDAAKPEAPKASAS